MGVLGCLLVTRGAGAAYGELMASAPLIAQYESLAADISARTGEAETPGRGPEALVASNVTFTYPGSHAPVITDASMRIKPGEFVAFVGANGSGKTTFAKPLGGILEPDAGTIAIGQASDAASRRARSAMVFQDFTRFEVTVRRFVDPLPGAIDAQLGPQWDGAGLSGGQWQRLALLASCCRIGTCGSSMSRPRPSTRTRRPRSTSSSPN